MDDAMRVKGEGAIPCDLMFVGEGPGKIESQTGRPFVEIAPAGAELSRYLNGYSLPHRMDTYITNLVKEWEGGSPTKKQEVTPADVLRDEWELLLELEKVQPKIVCTLGGHSTRWFLGKDMDMESCHGLLFKTSVVHSTEGEIPLAYDLYVLPCYHPAAGLHQPEMAARTAYDLNRLSEILKHPSSDWPSLCWKPAPKGYYQRLSGSALFSGWPPLSLAKTEIGYDTEGTPDKPQCFQVSDAPGLGFVMTEVGWLRSVIAAGAKLVMQNAMWEFQMASAMGVEIDEDRFDDIQVMAYLLGIEPQGLKALAYRHLGMDLPDYATVFGEEVLQFSAKTGKPLKKTKRVLKDFAEVPHVISTSYAGADPDATLQVKKALWPRIVDAGLEQIYEIDRRVLPVYARMEQVGMPIHMPHFEEFQTFLNDELETRTLSMQMEYPDLNPGSSVQVAQILYHHLSLPCPKKTPGGKDSTNDKILQSLKDTHPFVNAIIDWREISKLKGTFVDTLPKYIRPARDGLGIRLHFRLLPTRVISGRLAAKDPNVLALPKHSELGKRFRAGIRAESGRLLGSWDFNQIELRVLALDSGSDALREIFVKGQDLHTLTALRIFGVLPSQQDNSLHRLPAKAVNFGIPMGMTEVGLAEQMRKNGYKWPELQGQTFKDQKERFRAQAEVCKTWIETTIKDWEIEPYLEQKKAQARRHGYVTDLWGRRRYLPSVLSPNKMVREEALRMAQSFPIQAGARGFYKTVLAKVWREVIKPLKKEGYYIEPILDIHDDLLLEFQEDMAPWLAPLVESYFNGTFCDLPVPITCKGSVGQVWSTL